MKDLRNKIDEEKIITVFFLIIIFGMLIITVTKNYSEIKEQIMRDII